MAIDHKKVLMIYNTNPALVSASLENCDYYATQRGLRDPVSGNYHRMGFDFGADVGMAMVPAGISIEWNSLYGQPLTQVGKTDFSTLKPIEVTSSVGVESYYVNQSLAQAIASFIDNHVIECIVVDCNVPFWVNCGPQIINYPASNIGPFYDAYPYPMPIECYLAISPSYPNGLPQTPAIAPTTEGYLNSGTNFGNNFGNFASAMSIANSIKGRTRKPSIPAEGNIRVGVFPVSPNLNRFNDFNRNVAVPHGRLGYFGASTTEVKRIIDDAVWAEGQNNKVKHHLIGGLPYAASNIPYDNVTSNWFFARNGFTNLSYFDREPVERKPDYTGTEHSYDDFLAGRLPLDYFGLSYAGGNQGRESTYPAGTHAPERLANGFTNAADGAIYSSCFPQRGAWAYSWNSSAFLMGNLNLKRGGCAGVVNAAEPLANGIPGQLEFNVNLLAGLSMAESCYLSGDMTKPLCTVYGDPLYRPYVSTSNAPNEYR